MNIALWVLQVLLGIFLVFHATVLLRPSPKRLRSGMRYVLEMPAGLRVFAGVAEGLAGVGLVLPALVHVLVWLTPLAAAGLVVLMLARSSFTFGVASTRTSASTRFSDFSPQLLPGVGSGPYHF
jgi:hypothetical protein